MSASRLTTRTSRTRRLRGIFGGAVAAFLIAGSAFVAAPAALAEDTNVAEPAVSAEQPPAPETPTESTDESAPADAPEVSEAPPAAAPLLAPTEGAGADDESEDPGATTVALSASVDTIDKTNNERVTLTATLTPTAEGSVTFTTTTAAGAQTLGEPVAAAGGKAELTTGELPGGLNSITASFVPADDAGATPIVSEAVKITVHTQEQVSDATLSWGVKASFRNYIYNFTMFEGRTSLLGSTQQPEAKGIYEWVGGTGVAKTDRASADVSYGAGNGVHFQSHPMTVGGKQVYALDMTFTNPRVVVTSATTGELRMDVVGYEFKSMTEVGAPYDMKDAVIADLTLNTPEQNGSTLTWIDATAVLTAEGAKAFGGFYATGEVLDPVTFALPLSGEIVENTQKPTTTTLAVAPASITVGAETTLTATVAPTVDGTVAFRYGSTQIGEPVAVKGGTATLKTRSLPAGVHKLQATFTPSDLAAYAHSNSNVVELAVKEAPKGGGEPAPAPGSGSKAAGSLRWGVSEYFAGYTKEKSGSASCPTPSRHCAGGDIQTSGVGAGWTFPQAGADWNDAAQTGTVNFSGSVSFNGYGMTMYRVASPSITVHSATSATLNTGYSGSYGPSSVELNLGAASKSVGAGGEITWSNVPVLGGMTGISASQRINFDSLSFTVGSTSNVSYGTTAAGAATEKKAKRTPAAAPPATTGITVLTDASKLKPGGRIELEAAGFDPNDEGVLVVLYSDPIVLDEEAAADRNGNVQWSGTLPEDIEPGEHTITLQGSSNAGAVITVLDADEAKKAASGDKKKSAQQKIAAEKLAAAGILGAGSSGMALWEWWASAGGLVVIAACTTALAMRQRRSL